MFLSREIDIKLCQNYTKTYIYQISYKSCSIKQTIFNNYATNLKTTIYHRIIDNIICNNIIKNSQAPVRYRRFQIGCIIVEYGLFNTTTFIQNLIYIRVGIILTQLLETGTSDRCVICIVQCLRFSGFILYPLSFFLYSPFNLP